MDDFVRNINDHDVSNIAGMKSPGGHWINHDTFTQYVALLISGQRMDVKSRILHVIIVV